MRDEGREEGQCLMIGHDVPFRRITGIRRLDLFLELRDNRPLQFPDSLACLGGNVQTISPSQITLCVNGNVFQVAGFMFQVNGIKIWNMKLET